jgi:hypothetical protein
MPDLWPDDFGGGEDVTPPIVILREQAEALARRTRGMLTARVVTRKDSRGGFVHEFMVEVPTLDNYSYELFWVDHPVVLYPAKIVVEGRVHAEAADAGPFAERLREVLALPQLKKVIRALQTQAAQAGA